MDAQPRSVHLGRGRRTLRRHLENLKQLLKRIRENERYTVDESRGSERYLESHRECAVLCLVVTNSLQPHGL